MHRVTEASRPEFTRHMFEKLSAEDLLALFGMREEPNRSVALADSQENLALATYLVGRARYSC